MGNNQLQSILYHIKQTDLQINVIVKDESIWATQRAIAELFGVDRSVISRHLSNIFKEEELDEKVVCAKITHTTPHGAMEEKTQTREVSYYNLDAIISVGYRVNSKEATSFRIWATNILKEYTIQGYSLNREQLEQGSGVFGKDYFKNLLETIRSIRASERRIYQQITDIFAECSLDYDPASPITREFFAFIQNRFHYAITGKTASEIIYSKADSSLPHMGLTTWKNSPEGRILKSDTEVAKNYLTQEEIKKLERLISGYFDYIEDLVERENAFSMEEFKASVDKFLSFRDYQILPDNGKISRQEALEKAQSEYEIFNKTQKINSDFDKTLKALQKR